MVVCGKARRCSRKLNLAAHALAVGGLALRCIGRGCFRPPPLSSFFATSGIDEGASLLLIAFAIIIGVNTWYSLGVHTHNHAKDDIC
jgi:hypothetical protein